MKLKTLVPITGTKIKQFIHQHFIKIQSKSDIHVYFFIFKFNSSLKTNKKLTLKILPMEYFI